MLVTVLVVLVAAVVAGTAGLAHVVNHVLAGIDSGVQQ